MAVFFIYRLFYVLPNPLNRITAATDNTRRFGLSNLKYDKNGNITDLTRGGHLKEMPDWDKDDDFGTMDQLDYQYFDGSNRLRSVTDGILKNDTSGKGEFVDGNKDGDDYVYDPNGNMTQDLNKGIKGTTPTEKGIEYNHLNLPTKVSIDDGGVNKGTISYIYDATGVKLRKNVLKQGETTPTATDFAGNYIYENNKLQFFSTPEGYATPKNVNNYSAGFDYVYNYVDHLGNVRLSYMHNNGTVEIVKESNYYPFGLSNRGYNGNVSPLGNSVAKRFMFGGKEFDESLGLETYDFGARNYNPDLGRWMNIDPLAEIMPSHSPYNYGFNSPIYFMDTDGRSAKGFLNDPYLIFDAGENKIHIWDDNDTPNDPTDDVLIGSFDAHNSVVTTSNGNWPDGIYDMFDRFRPHKHTKSSDIERSIPAQVDEHGTRTYMSRDTKNGAYGVNGIYRANNFRDSRTGKTRRGMGVHAGREFKNFSNRKTNGCIRCEPAFFPAMEDAIKEFGGLTKIIVVNNSRGSNQKVDVTPQPITPIPVTPPRAEPLPIVPPVTPAPPPLVIPPRPPDSGF